MDTIHFRNRKAFTFIELVTVMGVIAILFSISVPQLFRLRDRNTLQTTVTTLISLIRQQQMNAMNSPNLYGVHFDQSKYTFFTGALYNEGDPQNTVNTLEYPLQFTSIQFPDSQIIFASGSGEIISFDEESHSITLEDVTHQEKKTIEFNILGVPTRTQ